MKLLHASGSNESITLGQKTINTILSENSGKPVLFLASGGSARAFLDGIEDQNLTSNITLGVLDERYSKDEGVNNYLQLLVTDFFERAEKNGVHIINTTIMRNERMDEMAERLESTLRSWVENNPDGVIIASMGIGPDGHTSGIMPYPEAVTLFNQLFEDPNKWVVAYHAQNKNPYPMRVTTTLTFLRKIDHAVVLVVGEEKEKALKKVLDQQGSLPETPARVIQEMKDVTLITSIKLPQTI